MIGSQHLNNFENKNYIATERSKIINEIRLKFTIDNLNAYKIQKLVTTFLIEPHKQNSM